MSQVKEIVLAITGFLNSLSNAYKEYLATRQETYDRKRDKQQVRCIQNCDLIVDRIRSLMIDDKQLNKLIAKHQRLNN